MKKKRVTTFATIIFLLIIGSGLIYYFYGKNNAIRIESETIYYDDLSIKYIDGSEVLMNLTDTTLTKNIEIKNGGDKLQEYRLVFYDVKNQLIDSNDLLYSYVCTSSGEPCESKNDLPSPITSQPLTNKILINSNVSHTYIITFVLDNTIYSDGFFAKISNNPKNNLFSVMSRDSKTTPWQYKEKIESITFNDEIKEPLNLFKKWDISEYKDESIVAYLTYDGVSVITDIFYNETPAYKLYIQSNDQIYANQDSSYLFSDFKNLETINNFNFFITSNMLNMNRMFYNCEKLTGLDLSMFDTSKVINMGDLFCGCKSLKKLDVSKFDTSNVTDMSWMFSLLDDSKGFITNLDLSHFDTSKVTNMSGMFYKCTSLTSLDLSNFNTSKVVNMNKFFYDCKALTSLNISALDTSKVTDMKYIFSNCEELENLNLSSFDTSNVTDMSWMFWNCKSLTALDLNNFNTSNVIDMKFMFSMSINLKPIIDCKLTSLDLSSFDTSNVTQMAGMFFDNASLTNLNLSSFNTEKVENMASMFYNCTSLVTLDLSNFDTSSLTFVFNIFSKCTSLQNLDIREMSFTNVKFTSIVDYEMMFSEITSGINIIVKDGNAKAFINSRLSEVGKNGFITIAV